MYVYRYVAVMSPFRVFHPILIWFRVIVMRRFLFPLPSFLVSPPLHVPVFAPSLPRRLVAEDDAFLGMVNIDLHLLLL
jgi:hypothetical protein